MIKAHIERDPVMDGYRFYLWDETPQYKVPFKFENGDFIRSQNDTLQWGEVMAPVMIIHSELYEAISRAIIGDAIDDDDALQDTRNVRDRLLSLIEWNWKNDRPA